MDEEDRNKVMNGFNSNQSSFPVNMAIGLVSFQFMVIHQMAPLFILSVVNDIQWLNREKYFYFDVKFFSYHFVQCV